MREAKRGRQVNRQIDLNPSLATQIYAFAIDPSLINLEQQILPGPFYLPGQVKKALGIKNR